MTRNDFNHAVRRLAREQDRVATVAQLAAVGVPQSRLREWCRPGGRWQRPLPRVVVLHSGPLTAAQRSRAALAFAGHPQVPAMITGVAGLALHGVAVAAPPCGLPVVDVLVPSERRIRTHTWVRVHHGRGLPVPDTVDGVPVAPVVRAAADGVRESIDPEWALEVVRELVAALGVPAAALAAELGGAVLARRPAVAALLDAVDSGPRAAPRSRWPEPWWPGRGCGNPCGVPRSSSTAPSWARRTPTGCATASSWTSARARGAAGWSRWDCVCCGSRPPRSPAAPPRSSPPCATPWRKGRTGRWSESRHCPERDDARVSARLKPS
ncbi:hypothetical protein [Actinacidiphila glaucinigra]|uniref:hypothetical protein n=1 Tax=Actinacidiphila glaucinigra TaxID=235986 RepID=UPI003D9162C3